MATKAAVARKFGRALERCQNSMVALRNLTGVSTVRIPTHARDKDWLRAAQLERVADYLERLVEKLQKDVTE